MTYRIFLRGYAPTLLQVLRRPPHLLPSRFNLPLHLVVPHCWLSTFSPGKYTGRWKPPPPRTKVGSRRPPSRSAGKNGTPCLMILWVDSPTLETVRMWRLILREP